MTRAACRRLLVLVLLLVIGFFYCDSAMLRMPGKSFAGPLPPLTPEQVELAAELRASVHVLADNTGGVLAVGNRSTYYPRRFAASAAWIHDQLQSFGYTDIREVFVERGSPTPNFEVAIPGTTKPDEIIVIGAHYDAFQGSPGADDNASGVAACLHYARYYRSRPMDRTLRIVFFVNEEPPAFQKPDMGSWVYAKACRAANDNILAMISVESIGYYSDKPGSQRYPDPLSSFYPDTGNFIAFVSNFSSRSLNKRCIAKFREAAHFPSEGGSPPGYLPGVGWSDHWAFWQEGYNGIMVTDTATFRNPYYHTPMDSPDRVDYEKMARVVDGLKPVIEDLCEQESDW